MSETLWGVIIGAVLAIAGGFLGEIYGFRLEKKRELRNKITEAYELAQKDILTTCYLHKLVPPEEERKLFEETLIKLDLYAAPEIADMFMDLEKFFMANGRNVDEMKDEVKQEFVRRNVELTERMRKDLGVCQTSLWKTIWDNSIFVRKNSR